ncbi:CxxH/CxxC protein [Sutcliffiella horikoshii]
MDKWYSSEVNEGMERIVDKMKCCLEHIELAMEMYIDEHEEAPILEMLPEEEKLSTTCELCSEPAVYMVGN